MTFNFLYQSLQRTLKGFKSNHYNSQVIITSPVLKINRVVKSGLSEYSESFSLISDLQGERKSLSQTINHPVTISS